ncbi:MAG: hypothetical protein HOL75_03605, partial [Nitrospina sp.]|nr:hypothetical protein [Nitrospina sp.]
YKAFRYLDLKARRFPRLLAREDFPFDQRHLKNEKSAKQPKQEEGILFQINQNGFMARENELEQSKEEKAHDPVLVPAETQGTFPEQDQGYNGVSIESETTKEFSPNVFKIQEFDDGLNSGKDISIDEPELNGEEFQ